MFLVFILFFFFGDIGFRCLYVMFIILFFFGMNNEYIFFYNNLSCIKYIF